MCGQRCGVLDHFVDRALFFCLHLLYHSRFVFVMLLQKFFLRPAGTGCTPTTTAHLSRPLLSLFPPPIWTYRPAASRALQPILGGLREEHAGGFLCACLLVPRLPCSPARSRSRNEVRDSNLVASCSRLLSAPCACRPRLLLPAARVRLPLDHPRSWLSCRLLPAHRST